MFRRILIANRGEIACRVIRTCRQLGIEAVAVASDADAGALHARLADRVVPIGGAAPAESYLDGARILAAARETGCEAIHPGYGFLAENADFARAVGEAGLTFIGPAPETIAAMGSKSDAKRRMEAAGVPVVPGYHGEAQDEDTLAAEAQRIGFPVLIKAAAGGGGKGMRIAPGADEFGEALAAARREARSAFGDDEVILERFVGTPRHIEVQVFADSHGDVVHLFERDCSAQRRYQKILEFAPALARDDATGEVRPLDDGLRGRITAAAIDAARAVGYRGAGTVEFLLEPDGHFWFMEMNTRLQVEHPVTECITGLDLVEWQLRVAAGEPLPLAQADIRREGYAVEARLYAENPEAGFLPSTGRIEAVSWPTGEDVRVDTGVEAGDAITVHYDPMIAKLVVRAATPEALFDRLEAALADTAVFGPHTNLRFLQRLAARLRARSGLCETTWVDREAADLAAPPAPGALPLLQAAVAEWRRQDAEAAARAARSADPHSPWAAPDGWRVGPPAPREARLALGDGRWRLQARVEAGRFHVGGDAAGEASRAAERGGRVTVTTADGQTGTARAHRHGARLVVAAPGERHAFEVVDRLAGERGAGGAEHDVLAPMPGKVIEVRVAEGEAVEAGQALVLLEAMKMELTVRAPRDAVVDTLPHGVGDFVEADTVLVHFGEEAP